MRTFQTRLHIATACAFALMLAACATTSDTPGQQSSNTPYSSTTTTPRPPASAPKVDWATLQKELAAALRETPDAEVGEPTVSGLHLRIPVSNGFGSGSADPRPALAKVLDNLVAPLTARPAISIKIIGHTDSQGSEMYNLQLSIRRAEAVMEYLRSRGIALDRLAADGKGEMEPIADNAKEATRARNRRVEIYLGMQQ